MHELRYVFECDNKTENNISKPIEILLCLHKSVILTSLRLA